MVGGDTLQRVCGGEGKKKFPLVLLQAKVVGMSITITTFIKDQKRFPLVLLQAKVVGVLMELNIFDAPQGFH